MLSFREKVKIHLAHDRAVTIRIVQRPFGAVPAHRAHAIIAMPSFFREDRLIKSVVVQFLGENFLSGWKHNRDLARIRTKHAN